MNHDRRRKPERHPNAAELHLDEVKFTATERTKRWTQGCRTVLLVAVLYAPLVYLQPKIVGAVVTATVTIWRTFAKK